MILIIQLLKQGISIPDTEVIFIALIFPLPTAVTRHGYLNASDLQLQAVLNGITTFKYDTQFLYDLADTKLFHNSHRNSEL